MKKFPSDIIGSYLINNFLGLFNLAIVIITFQMEGIGFISLFLVGIILTIIILTYGNYRIYKKQPNFGLYMICTKLVRCVGSFHKIHYV